MVVGCAACFFLRALRATLAQEVWVGGGGIAVFEVGSVGILGGGLSWYVGGRGGWWCRSWCLSLVDEVPEKDDVGVQTLIGE